MNEKQSFESQLKDFTKKLENSQITLLQVRNLKSEHEKLIDHINATFQEKFQTREKKELTKEEIEEVEKISKLSKEFLDKYNPKIFSFVDKWEAKEFSPNDREVRFLQTFLANALNKKKILEEAKEDEKYQKDENYTKQVDKFEQDNALPISYHNKLLFLVSQYYNKKTQTSSSASEQKKPTVLPWTLAIIFGIMTVILAGIAGFLFYKQRKIKQFKV